MAGIASVSGLGQASRSWFPATMARWRVPPIRRSAADTMACAAGERPSLPSSPMPTMDSQRPGWFMSAMILILGGTTEAMQLARLLAVRPDLPAMLSLAGRTQDPALPPIPYRIGGFGGVNGLAAALRDNGVAGVIDATHPFARRIAANAIAACALTRTPLLALRR